MNVAVPTRRPDWATLLAAVYLGMGIATFLNGSNWLIYLTRSIDSVKGVDLLSWGHPSLLLLEGALHIPAGILIFRNPGAARKWTVFLLGFVTVRSVTRLCLQFFTGMSPILTGSTPAMLWEVFATVGGSMSLYVCIHWFLRTGNRQYYFAPDEHTRCSECSYILDGLSSHRCPECGCPITRGDEQEMGR